MTRAGTAVRAAAGRVPAADAVVAGLVMILSLATLHMSPQGADAWGTGGITVAVVLSALLLAVRLCTVPALTAMIAMFLVAQAQYGLVPLFALALIVAVFVAAEATSRQTAVVAGPVVAVAIDLGALLTRHDTWTDSAYLVMATAALGAAAAGDAVRQRRAYVREVEQRMRRAESSREQFVQRRLAEERLDIARDVHDLVAHHLAVIKVQSEVADQLIATQPVVALAALSQVRTTAGSALSELGSLIGVLRRTDPPSTAPVAPSPTMASLPQLIASFEATGLRVDARTDGDVRQLSPAVELVVYRLVQESLTNAHKHGDGRVELRVRYDPGQVVIDVANTSTAHSRSDGTGHGLVGMRERVTAVGGSLRVERTAGGDVGAPGFHLRAELPCPVSDPVAASDPVATA